MLTHADVLQVRMKHMHSELMRMEELTRAHTGDVCSRMLTYADVF